MALNRLEQDQDLHPWQIHGEDYNGGPGQSLSLDDNTGPALSSTGGWGDESYFK